MAVELVTSFPRVSHVRGNAGWSFPAVGKETQHRHILQGTFVLLV